MSDTVKLIVTLSKGQYENLKNIQCGSIGSRMIVNAVMNGIPLDDVKAEIKTFTITEKSEYDIGFNDAVLKCFNILDNIGKAENEVKPNE